MKIGQTVWLFNCNRRVYGPDGHGAPIYREYFVPYVIKGETRTSWLLGENLKINKATGELRPERGGFYGLSPHVFTTEEEVNDACYIHCNAYEISRLVQQCRNAKVLRTIANMLSLEENMK